MKLLSKTSTQALLLAISCLGMTGFGSCSTSMQEACQTQIPLFQKTIESAQLEVRTKFFDGNSNGGRYLASVTTDSPVKVPVVQLKMTAEEKTQWQDWAEHRIKEIQSYMDVARDEVKIGRSNGSIQAELTQAADEIVSFDGFAERNQIKFMLKALASAKVHVDTAAHLACSQ